MNWTFSHKLAVGFAAIVLLTVAMAGIATWALQSVVAGKDRVITVNARALADANELLAASADKGMMSRGYLLSLDERFPYLEATHQARARFLEVLDRLRREAYTEEGRRIVEEIGQREADHHAALEAVMAFRKTSTPEAAADKYDREVLPKRQALDKAIQAFVDREKGLLGEGMAAASQSASSAIRVLLGITALSILLATLIALYLARTLTRQIGTAVRHVQSSSAELQAASGQQATGAKEQATAMSEVTTTINELLATSRQIAESAQRVAGFANETATAARGGDQGVLRSQESLGGIRRQVELIANHMLDLGRRSQQIGGILELINELAEQTNILAINATIEAAGAGEAGRRFAVVADEIRKLADRVAGSTKDIRPLIDEIRTAVNTTVMATESGGKAVEGGARQFADMAAAFKQIAALVATTTEAAREIELSTKQQATAVEQVNTAIANVAGAAREAEISSGQALKTASQLAEMSRQLARLVQTQAAA